MMRVRTLIASLTLLATTLGGPTLAWATPLPTAYDLPEIPREVFTARRHALARQLPDEKRPLVIESGKAPKGQHDIAFRVDSNFTYLTGLDVPGAKVILWREGDSAREILVLPAHRQMAARWEAPVLHAASPQIDQLGFERVVSNRARVLQRIEAMANPYHPSVAGLLTTMRQTKDDHELLRLSRACEITSVALLEAGRSMQAGMRERDVEAVIRYMFRRLGAPRAAFPVIAGSGPNSCILHYRAGTRMLAAGDLIVCDVGAEIDRYAADITRTFPVSGQFTDRQREVYNAVLKSQLAGIAAAKPGNTMAQVHAAARGVLEEAGLAQYFFHTTSHWVGLEVHDVGHPDVKLAPGMVLTVEPGVYIDSEQIGIRIEDVVAITESGCRVLSAGIAKKPEAIESLMRGDGVGNAPFGLPSSTPQPQGH